MEARHHTQPMVHAQPLRWVDQNRLGAVSEAFDPSLVLVVVLHPSAHFWAVLNVGQQRSSWVCKYQHLVDAVAHGRVQVQPLEGRVEEAAFHPYHDNLVA